jgi:hypothetical protein
MTKILWAAAALIACTAAVAQQGGKPATIEDLIKQGLRYEEAPKAGQVAPMDQASYQQLMKNLEAVEPPPKRELGPIDRWRYDSCRTEASKAPTKEGVRAGLQVCHEKFGQ